MAAPWAWIIGAQGLGKVKQVVERIMHFLKGVEKVAKRLVPVSWRKYFRASRYELLMQRMAPIDLIVHVGAHWAEDAAFYEASGAKTVLWIEADPDTYKTLKTVVAGRGGATRHLTENALVSARAGQDAAFPGSPAMAVRRQCTWQPTPCATGFRAVTKPVKCCN